MNRFGTAAAVSSFEFHHSVPVVFIATGATFADALAGGPAAAKGGGPILLVQRDVVPLATDAELRRLTPGRIVVLGGPGAVSEAVVAMLSSYTSGGVTRIFGADRYATSAAISRASFGPNVALAYVATGDAFADALAGGAVAGAEGAPMLLVPPGAITAPVAAELARLHPAAINVLGGNGAVSQGVEEQLGGFTSGAVNRVSGPDRYQTAVTLSAETFRQPVNVVFLATGVDFPDGLAGGVVAARRSGPVLLVPGACVPPAVNDEIARLTPGLVVIVGGPNAVSPSVDALLPCAPGPSSPSASPPPPTGKTFGDGQFVVGGDIPSGTYRTRSDSPGCYWERESGFSGALSDIIANNFDNFHQVVTIAPTDIGFKSDGCGTWTTDLSPITASLTAPFGDGMWIVNTDTGPGTWSAPGGSECYWSRLSGFSGDLSDIEANDFGTTHPIVTIAAGDAGFTSSNCGTWTKT